MQKSDTNNILFHDFKHHMMTGIEWIQEHTSWNESMQNQLLTIGAAQLDYYTGILNVYQIKEGVGQYLDEHTFTRKEAYKKWLDKNSGYQEITLSDESRWTLRMIEKKEFIHIHPSRQSLHTVRIKANTLKTVVCTLALTPVEEWQIDIDRINHIRKEYLDLSPIKKNDKHHELESLMNLFIKKINGQ